MDYTYCGPVFRTDQLVLGSYLAKGGFGEVHSAKLRTEAGPLVDVVVKQFFPTAGSQAGRAFRSQFEKESAIQMHLECPYIAKLIGITEGDCWQILELVGLEEVISYALARAALLLIV
jgi:hypothetical protein